MRFPFKQPTNEYLERAREALRSAELLFAAGDTIGAGNRAYYAAFYAAGTAIAHVAGITVTDVKTHHGLRRLFDLHLVKTGLIDRDIASLFSSIESTRIAGDYRGQRPQRSEIEAALRDAAEFVDACETAVRTHKP
jgi:uncharacterized protein (UPF0332 family)